MQGLRGHGKNAPVHFLLLFIYEITCAKTQHHQYCKYDDDRVKVFSFSAAAMAVAGAVRSQSV